MEYNARETVEIRNIIYKKNKKHKYYVMKMV